MVQTRRQWREWRDQGFPSTQESESECEECEEAQNDFADWSQNSMDNRGIPNLPQSSYRPNDRCHRHRISDDVPYTEVVRSYRRRK